MINALKERIAGRLQLGLYTQNKRYGLRRDLSKPLKHPVAKIPIEVRRLSAEDLDALLPLTGDDYKREWEEIESRRSFYEKFPDSCYVAVDKRTNTPCYMQWLIGAKHNEALARFKCFPWLNEDEALLEHAYTRPSHRGMHIMSAAMAGIAEQAYDFGAQKIITFVGIDNIGSLKGCERAGFEPYLLHYGWQAGYGVIIVNDFTELPMVNEEGNWFLSQKKIVRVAA